MFLLGVFSTILHCNNGWLHAQPAPFREQSVQALHEWIGSDRHEWITQGIKETRNRTRHENRQESGNLHTTFATPFGNLEQIQHWDADSESWHPVTYPVATVEDIRILTAWFEDVTVTLDPEAIRKAHDQATAIGQQAVTAISMGTSAFMEWIQMLAGVENGHLLLLDYPDETNALFQAIHRIILDRTRLLVEHSPADLLYLVENTSTTLISPDQYRTYCLPHIQDYAAIIQGANRNMVLHMCGHLKALLPTLATIPARAFEAFTSPPVGNTTLLNGRTLCPDTCLIGGTNAVLWTQPADIIIRELEQHLNALPHHRGIVVTSAGVMSYAAHPETIRQVCEWVKRYVPRR